MISKSVIIALMGGVLAYKSAKCRHYLRANAVPSPRISAWTHLFRCGDNSSFINLTGFDFTSFHELHAILFEGIPNKKLGRKAKLDTRGKLGLLLLFLNATIGVKHLCLIFGITPSCVSRTLHFMIDLVISKLFSHVKSKISWPSEVEKEEFAELISNREPLIDHAIGFIDGLALRISCSDDADEQNAYYNCWHGDTYINNILVFSSRGKVCFT
jgi:hypothetical protein